MEWSSLKSWRTGAVLFTGACFLFACAAAPAASTKKKRTPAEPGDEFYDDETGQEEQPIAPTSNADSGAFGAGERPATGRDGGDPRLDAGPTDGGPLPKIMCAGAVSLGDLAVVELMISSRAGSGDDGEWVEIQSTRNNCWLNLKGLVIESPRGALPANSVTITEDFELPPSGTFIVAASADPAKNGIAPGSKVFAWGATDVLKNDGDTVALKMGAVAIDTLTYPAFSNIEPGRALAFPDDCTWAVRGDWARWSLTFTEYKPGKKGTPNATNGDVACY